jgi:glycosyltransferase involved in cell wall biosynthesis
MLRCTNYLGNAVLARSMGWVVAGCPLFDGSLYGYALQLLRVRGRNALAHIDTVLVHSKGQFHAELESLEYAACTRELSKGGLVKSVRPLERMGTWLPEYAVPQGTCVSLVIPTGIQTGYMRSLLDSLHRYPQDNLAEIILVCSPDQVSEVEYALANVQVKVPYKIVELEQESYNHGAALNVGISHAANPYILVSDDDTEIIQEQWLAPLLGIAAQSDVGCVAPRLLTNRGADARVTGGPLVLGINGASAPYNGDLGLLLECGVQSRLQLTQDVGGVTGHFFLFRKADWTALNGFDVATFGLWFTVLDFCLRMSQRGKRHVWTPLVSVMHQGGKTVSTLTGDVRMRLKMADSELTERNNLLRYWAETLANDPNYNRHLSLLMPFDIESTIVVDWNPRRHDRPRVLACPLTSGAGQYRVVEPLNALQDGGLAQTCAVIPLNRGQSRILQPLELVRAAPDKLILQHSVDDAQLGMIEKYKLAMPNITIIQMVDDVLGEVPVKHPNWNFQKREGHQRMVQALKKSDRLVVTTETLLQHYKKYVADVRLLPNCLDKQWADLRQVHASPERLRVGWVGAGQHRGDLELITEVVKQLAPEVDWVFMGMCTDEIKPYLKEFHGFVSIDEYPNKMASLRLDIAIAPLETNFFNECKSNLRLLEYGALGWPVVCSDVFPYRTLDAPVSRCSDSVEEWVAALRVLINDEALRLRKGAELNTWVQTHFLLKNRLSEWHSAIFNKTVDSVATAQSLQEALA